MYRCIDVLFLFMSVAWFQWSNWSNEYNCLRKPILKSADRQHCMYKERNCIWSRVKWWNLGRLKAFKPVLFINALYIMPDSVQMHLFWWIISIMQISGLNRHVRRHPVYTYFVYEIARPFKVYFHFLCYFQNWYSKRESILDQGLNKILIF